MTDYPQSDLFNALSEQWQKAVDKENFHEALTIGIGAYLTLREQKDELWADGSLALISIAIERLNGEGMPPNDETCSFCMRSTPKERLGAGANAFICSDCVGSFSEAFSEKRESSEGDKKK